jgi:hypothetical protein
VFWSVPVSTEELTLFHTTHKISLFEAIATSGLVMLTSVFRER